MYAFGEALKKCLAASGLSEPEFAKLSRLPLDRVTAWVSGESADGASMDRCALVMGVRLSDFLNGEGERAEVAMLFRRSNEPALESARGDLLALDSGLGLSRFCRVAYELRDLRKVLALPIAQLPELANQYSNRPQAGGGAGDYLALAARRALALDPSNPIASMKALLEQLGIPLVIASPGEVDPRVSGASVLHPIPTILLVPVWSNAWVTRMTLAHELCHLLFHREGFSVSEGSDAHRGWMLDSGYASREQEANAFAAAFLAPANAVRQLLQGLKPDSALGVSKVGSHFRVGKRVAVNRIVDLYRLSDARRDALLNMDVTWESEADPDRVGEAELGILAGTVRTLTYQALEKGLISKTRARNVLGVPDAEPLESEALSPAVRAPVITAGAFAARLCQLELVKKGHHLVAEEPELKGDGSFRVQLADPYGKHVGQVDIDRDGQLLSEPVFG